MQALVASRRFLIGLEISAFDNDAAVGHLTDAHEEVFRLDFASDHLRIVIDLYLLCEDATLFVLLLHELIPDLKSVCKCLVLTNNLRFVLLQSHHDSLMSHFVRLDTRQSLLYGLFTGLVSSLHCKLLGCRICL